MKVLDPEGRIPLPTVRVVSQTNTDWSGIIYTNVQRNSERDAISVTGRIDIQSYVAGIELSARRIIAHECCHLAQYWKIHVDVPSRHQEDLNIAKNKAEKGHGSFFLEQAAKINAIYGESFVTIRSDHAIEKSERPKIYYLLEKVGDLIKFAICGRPSYDQIAYIRKLKDAGRNIRMVYVPEVADFRKTTQVGAGWNVAKEDRTEAIEMIEQLWNSEDVLEQVLKMERKVPAFWIVMINGYGTNIDFFSSKIMNTSIKTQIKNLGRFGEVRVVKSDNSELLKRIPQLGRGAGITNSRLNRLMDDKDYAETLWDMGTPERVEKSAST